VVNAGQKPAPAAKAAPAPEPAKPPAAPEEATPLLSKGLLAVIVPAGAALVFALILWAASVSGDKGSAAANIIDLLPGILFPAVVFAISYYLTWLLYKHFTKKIGA
jgi:hypothetical protein